MGVGFEGCTRIEVEGISKVGLVDPEVVESVDRGMSEMKQVYSKLVQVRSNGR